MEANMITPAYSPTATERVLPRMALDFTTGVLDPRVTVTRALNTATCVNSSGLVELINANLPRFDYNPTTLAPKGLLIEEARTNLLLNSVFDGAVSGTPGTFPTSWAVGFLGNGGTLAVAGLGRNFTANSLRFSATANRQYMTQSVTLAANSTYVLSVSINVFTTLNLTSFVALSNLPVGATTQYVYNGVNQLSSYIPPTGVGLLQVVITTTALGGATQFRVGVGCSANSTADASFQDVQLELGAFATSYIPTTTTSLTRNADVVSMTGTNFSDWYNASEGAFVVEGSVQFGTTRYLIGGSASQRLVYGTTSGSLGIYDGTNVVNVAGGVSGQTFKIATSYGNAFGLAASLNGSVVAKGSYSGAFSVLTSIGIFSTSAGTATASGYAKKIYYYPLQLTDSEVRAFSK